MELRHLRYFTVLAEELHFGRAADRLGISQPPLSQQIRALETELSVRLFERTNRRVALTEAGRLFLAEARATLAQADRARMVASRAHLGEIGELAIGLFPSALLAPPIADAILAFRKAHPAVRLVLRETAAHPTIEALAEGSLGLAFLRYGTPPQLPKGHRLVEMMREPMMLVLHRTHRLARSRVPVPLTALAEEPFIHFSPRAGNALHDHVAAICEAAGFTPRIAQEANQNGSILALVGNALGISILPRSLCRLRLPELRILPLAEPRAVSRIWMAYRTRGGGSLLADMAAHALAAHERHARAIAAPGGAL
ncbi:LysR family transcriptional regulator [Roseomonas hellenica]|uniref:LysR family transcriptional regulator n=1 Tax=Plastoroseomonas hellenica TaxID=2687306 RepID=A0ABS5ER58_9PROT|nr:LysR substrate-binding domain-containing protein [Plastoroseomonas hellenica]MBR0662782.1 LysR family transcriptional regulator [Plastoroseomonas hellenica]